jgi:hypothetical protein
MENLPKTRICPKCGGNMIKGKIIDTGYLSATQQTWTTSAAMVAMLGGGKNTHYVATYACEKCRFLESYLV